MELESRWNSHSFAAVFIKQKERQYTYNVTSWCVRLTILLLKPNNSFVCFVDDICHCQLYKNLSVVQQYPYGKLMSTIYAYYT
jgi:hypothetical protein